MLENFILREMFLEEFSKIKFLSQNHAFKIENQK